MTSSRKAAVTVGVLFILTFITSTAAVGSTPARSSVAVAATAGAA
jgi:hypothetical protein